MVSVLLLGAAYNSDNSAKDNGDNNRMCSLGSQECRSQIILHQNDGLAKKQSQ